MRDGSTQTRRDNRKILEFFRKHIPEQNPIVHQKHIFKKFVVIS